MKKSSLWRTIALTSFAVAVFGVGTAAAQGPGSGVWQMVHVGGNDACEAYGLEPGCDANYSLSAVKFFDGETTGQYMDRLAGLNGFHGEIECLLVYGNRAFVAGTLTSEFPPGERRTFYAGVEDNGTSSQDPVDRISPTFRTALDAQSLCDIAETNPDAIAFVWDFLFDYARGQVKIR